MSGWPHPAYVIRTPRLTIRSYERGDVEPVHRGVLQNLEALRPWMPWTVSEPKTREERAEDLRRFRGRFDLGEDFLYGIFDEADRAYLGGAGLHPRTSPGVLEIGYWVVESRWGEGLGTEVAAVLTQIGFDVMEARRIEIRAVPQNARSRAIPTKLGYREEGTLRGLDRTGERDRDLVVYGMLRAELEKSPAIRVAYEIERFERA